VLFQHYGPCWRPRQRIKSSIESTLAGTPTLAKQLETLMEKYGWNTISRKKAEYPFYFLASSTLWNININRNQLKHSDAPSKKEMETAVGSLDENVYTFLVNNPATTQTIIDFIKGKWLLNHLSEI
jgi:hypothetical protein